MIFCAPPSEQIGQKGVFGISDKLSGSDFWNSKKNVTHQVAELAAPSHKN